jgi:hypothetical protein
MKQPRREGCPARLQSEVRTGAGSGQGMVPVDWPAKKAVAESSLKTVPPELS